MRTYLQASLSFRRVLHYISQFLAKAYALQAHRVAWETCRGKDDQKTRKRENPVTMAEWSQRM